MPESLRRNFCSPKRPSLMLLAKSSMRFRSTMYGRTTSLPAVSRAIQRKSPTLRRRTSCAICLSCKALMVASRLRLDFLKISMQKVRHLTSGASVSATYPIVSCVSTSKTTLKVFGGISSRGTAPSIGVRIVEAEATALTISGSDF